MQNPNNPTLIEIQEYYRQQPINDVPTICIGKLLSTITTLQEERDNLYSELDSAKKKISTLTTQVDVEKSNAAHHLAELEGLQSREAFTINIIKKSLIDDDNFIDKVKESVLKETCDYIENNIELSLNIR